MCKENIISKSKQNQFKTFFHMMERNKCDENLQRHSNVLQDGKIALALRAQNCFYRIWSEQCVVAVFWCLLHSLTINYKIIYIIIMIIVVYEWCGALQDKSKEKSRVNTVKNGKEKHSLSHRHTPLRSLHYFISHF